MPRSRFDADFRDASDEPLPRSKSAHAEPTPLSPNTRVASFAQRAPKDPRVRLPYRLYVDSETLVEPVHDLTTLRRGDHCMVGLNPVRKVSRLVDATFTWLATWELWPLYHHMIMWDDVVAVDADGIPLNACGEPALICEYSNTPAAAFRQMRQFGFMHLCRNLASFKQLPLHDYSDSRHPHGLLRIVRRYSEAERDEIIRRLAALLENYESYHLFFRNCEHVANATTLSRIGSEHMFRTAGAPSPTSKSRQTWVSPQVPHVLFTLVRFALQLVGAYSLYHLSMHCCDLALVWPWFREAPEIKRNVALYHLFATTPCALQVAIQLGRAVRALKRNRHRGKVCDEMYRHLLGKEVARAVLVGIGTTTTIVLLPRLMHDLQLNVRSCCVMLVLAYMSSSLLYNMLASAGIRILLRLRVSRLVRMVSDSL